MIEFNSISMLVLGLGLALSFLFSGMESGVFALNRLRIRQLVRAGDRSATVLHGYLERSENFLWTIFVGNTVVNFVIFTFVGLIFHRWLNQWPVAEMLAYIAAIFLFFILFELLPKTLFRLFPNRLCLVLAQPFRLIHFILRPLTALAGGFTRWLLPWTGGKVFTGRISGNRDELRFVMQESSQNLSAEEKTMINRVLDLQNLTVATVAIPLSETVTVPTDLPMAKVLDIYREHNLTRMPVIRRDAGGDRVIGVLSLKKLLYLDELDLQKTAGDYVNPALYLPENLRLEEALRRMQRSGRRLAIVLAQNQREVGVISLQDILKSIFGEINL